MPSRRDLARLGLAGLALPALLREGHAQSPEVTLKLHHFLPAVSNVHRYFLQPWAEKVSKESNGRLRIQIFPSMQLGGAPPQLYDQARDGVADITWTLPGNTPGRFPRIEVFELPFVSHKKAIVNCLAVQEFADRHCKEEFAEVHPLCVWGHGEGLIHARKPVEKMEDLQGLKLRFPSRLNGEALRALGASPVGMPVPQIPESLSQGVIDGAVVPWEVVPSIKLQEMVKNHTEIPGSPTLYIATFILGMNKAKYAALPEDLRKVLDDNSGAAAARMAAVPWDERGPVVEADARRRGNKIILLAEAEKERWVATTKPVVDGWVKAAEDKNLNGTELLADARALVKKHSPAAS